MQSNTSATLFVAGILLLGCGDAGRRNPGSDTDPPGTVRDNADASPTAGDVTAPVRNAAGKELGTLTLAEAGGGIALAGRLTGLPPGQHAIHLHATGRCDPSAGSGQAAPSFESAGDHWNPTKAAHGTKSPKGPHLGDLPNITVARDSSVTVQATTPGGTLRGQNGLLDADGASVVVHAKRDDNRSQPAGDSGDRIACGVVGGR